METPFKIIFDLNLDLTGKIMHLQGEAELRHSIPHYKVSRINRQGQDEGPDILPDVDLLCTLVDGKYKWVHRDSGKETYLSKAIGAAIENIHKEPAVADENNDGEEEL